VLAARNAAKAETVKEEIAAATGAPDVDYILGDLISLSQTRRLAETFHQRRSRLDVLVNKVRNSPCSRSEITDGVLIFTSHGYPKNPRSRRDV
jgi:NAD(P)-dependent dehydrogenase (short-subunit alcohol dehydrogenase family)